MDVAAQNAGAVTELSASRKSAKYTELKSRYLFQSIVVKSLGPLNGSAVSFLSGLGQRVTEISGENREDSFLFQRLSVLIQRFNAVLLHDCFVDEVAGHSSYNICVAFCIRSNLWNPSVLYVTEGKIIIVVIINQTDYNIDYYTVHSRRANPPDS